MHLQVLACPVCRILLTVAANPGGGGVDVSLGELSAATTVAAATRSARCKFQMQ
jgi:uncharacterized protein YbaR (Trm112 family)